MKSFNIYFNDLNDDAKNRFLQFMNMTDPKEGNYDVNILPIATVDVEVEEPNSGKFDRADSGDQIELLLGHNETFEAVELDDLDNPQDEPIRCILIPTNYGHKNLMTELFVEYSFNRPMFMYDIRDTDDGRHWGIEEAVIVNFGGTLITNRKLELKEYTVGTNTNGKTVHDRVALLQQPEENSQAMIDNGLSPKYDYNYTGEEFYPSDFENYLYDTFPEEESDVIYINATTIEAAFEATIDEYNKSDMHIIDLLDSIVYTDLPKDANSEVRKMVYDFINSIE